MIKVNIENILNKQNKSIYWLANKTELSYPTVYNLVKNKTLSIHFNTLEKIIKALEIKDFNKIFSISDK